MDLLRKQKNQGVLQDPGKQRLSLAEIAVTGGQQRIRDVSSALWFPAGQPINPVAPRGTPPRRYAFQPMTNINWTTRDGQVDFQTLRNFSYYPIVRDIVETVKDLLYPVNWDFMLKPDDEDEPGSSIKVRTKKDPRLKELRKFFRKPDGVQPFRAWLRGLYDDMLVIDAASIWKQRDQSNRICSLIQIDGAQVFPLIDETGMQPSPEPYSKMLVQTSLKKASKEYLAKKAVYDQRGGSPAFQLTPYGFPAQQLTASELTYALYNRLSYRRYGFSKIEVCLAYIALALGRLDFQAAFYRSGNMPEGIAFLPPEVPPARAEELNKYLDTILAGQTRNRRKIIYLPSYGSEKQPNLIFPKINEQVLKDEFDDMLVRYLCHCFGLDPSSFMKQTARLGGQDTNAQQAQRNEALAPCIAWTKLILDGIIQDDLGYADIEAKPIIETDLDEEKQSQIALAEFESGLQTLDEARDKRGYDLIGEEWAQVPLVKVATGYVRVDGLPMPGQQQVLDAGLGGEHGGPFQTAEKPDTVVDGSDGQGGSGGAGDGSGSDGGTQGGESEPGDTHNYYFGGSAPNKSDKSPDKSGDKKFVLVRKSPTLVVRRPVESDWIDKAGPLAQKDAPVSTGTGLSMQGIIDGRKDEGKVAETVSEVLSADAEDWLDKLTFVTNATKAADSKKKPDDHATEGQDISDEP